jgi:polyisoprenoid-binding protein YceI
MKYTFFLVSLLLSFSSKAISQSTWELDDAHSNLRFSLTHLMVSEIEGSVKITEATITSPKEDFSDASVYLVGDMNSIDTDNDARDEHLRTADFFDTEKYPTIIFKSTSFKKTDEHKYTVTGDLTFHGITKPATLEVIANLGINPYDNSTIAGFRVSGTIRRSDFGISTSTPSALLSDETNIMANVKFVKKT